MDRSVALLGWSLPVIESVQKLDRPFVVVSRKRHGLSHPKPGYIKELWIPEELKEDPYFFGPSEVGDLARVDDAEVTQVQEISLASWGKSYTWLD